MRAKVLALAAVLAAVGGCCCVYPPYPASHVAVVEGTANTHAAAPMTLDEVLRLSKAGISEDLILSRIRTEGLNSKPTADQVIEMKRLGVSDRVIEATIGASVPASTYAQPAQPRVVYRYPAPYYYPPYGYPYPYYGWPGWYYRYW
jgi:hypothetical protein